MCTALSTSSILPRCIISYSIFRRKILFSFFVLPLVLAGCSGESVESGQMSEILEEPSTVVEITAQGFLPSSLNMKQGQSVQFVNKDTADHWPASDTHPTHQACPGFDANKRLKTGETYSFKFAQKKICPFHDHLKPRIKGTIIVQ